MILYGNCCGIVANVLDCDTAVSKFKLPLCYCIHFQSNTLREGMNPLISPVIVI